jgi:Mg-chelatase subunit ChlD
LIVVGGDRALTAGDYGHSRLEEVLPVLCESRREIEKPGLAMVMVIDCSSSMAEANSIELAREAARRAVQRLGPRDQVGILAFGVVEQQLPSPARGRGAGGEGVLQQNTKLLLDGRFTEQTRWVSEIGPCSDQAKQEVLRQIETIQADGRTDMYPAVEKAWLALRDTFADRKHMIVLTDGISHPGDFEQLARDVAADGITVSTVGLGREAVPLLLTRIAEIGGGTYYPCDDPAAVPSIFAQETLSAARVGIVEKPFSPKAIDAAEVFGDLDLGRIPALLGYVETYPKPAARVLLESESGDPLLACWQYGRGTSVVFTSDIQADWAATWLQWSDFGPFWARLARFALRKDAPNDSRRLALVAGYPDELRFRPTDTKLLQAIATAGGGRYDPKPADVFARPQRGIRQTTELWTYLLAAAVLLFLLDVTLKRVGFSRRLP